MSREERYYYEPIVYVVPPSDEGMLLKTVLQNRLGMSRKLLSRLKLTEQGQQKARGPRHRQKARGPRH